MHVQFVSLPYASNQALIDFHENLDYRVIKKDVKGISLLEVLYNGQTLKEQGGLSGDGYFNYIERAGRISFFPTRSEVITIPARFNNGWHIINGAIEISANTKHLINVLPNSKLGLVELYYFPKNFLFLLIVGPVVLLISLISVRYLKRRKLF